MIAGEVAHTAERFGAFRVESLLGRGGMGVVLRAVHERTGERVAIKTVNVDRAFDVVGLRREIHALRRLDHPGVVRIVDSGVRDSVPWYAMPLLEGETLASFGGALRGASTSISGVQSRVVGVEAVVHGAREDIAATAAGFGQLPRILTIARRLATTLAFLHGEGIVHRDLTPLNVFLVDGDLPRLLDFGLVRGFAGHDGRESIDDPFGLGGGTTGYVAPEQAGCELGDARSDLWSLGAILYELITGRLPDVRAFVPARALVRDLPAALDGMLSRLLADDPSERFGHAAELVPILAAHGAIAAPWERTHVPRGYLYRPRCIGRAKTLDAIDDRLGRALERRGGCVLLVGESGLGKTYVAMQAARVAASYGVDVLAASCGAPDAETPSLHAFRSIVQAMADRCLGDPELARALFAEGRALAAIEPRVAALPVVSSCPPLAQLPEEADERRLLAALAAVLDAWVQRRPCMIVLDDLHWADPLTVRFLAELPDDWFERRGLLFVVTSRFDEGRERSRALAARPWTTSHALARLDDAEVAALVADALALKRPDPEWISGLARASGGNPFFVTEYLRAAIEDGTLRRDEGGAWRFDADVVAREPSTPKRLESIIARRLDALSGPARRLLEALVVLDSGADAEVAGALARVDEDAALDAIRELVTHQIVEARERALFIVHDAVRETARRRLSDAERHLLHRTAAELLERRRGAGDAALCASIARHCAESGDRRRAVAFLERAADHARAVGAQKDALAWLDRAASFAESASVDALTRARLARKLGDVSHALGDLRAVDGHLGRALALLDEAEPRSPRWLASLAVDLPAQVVHRTFATRVADEEAEQARLAEAARIFDRIAERAYFGFDASVMVAASLRAVNRAERAGLALARPYAMLGITVGLGKLHALAHRYFALARDAARTDPEGEPFAAVAEAAFLTGEARWTESRPLVERAIERCLATGDQRVLGLAETLVGHEQFHRGNFRDSVATFERLEERSRRDDNRQYRAWGLYAAARAQLPLGELDSARRKLEEADALLAVQDDAPSKVITTGLLAATHLELRDRFAAREAADRCEALIRTTPKTVFSTVSGYAAICEVRLDAWNDEASRRRARRAVEDLERLAFVIPLARAAAARMRARLSLLEHRRPHAIARLEVSLAEARRMSLPYEEALAHATLADVLGDATHRALARRIASELGCEL